MEVRQSYETMAYGPAPESTKAARAWLYTILRNEHARLYERQRPLARDPQGLPEIPVSGYDDRAEALAAF